MIEITCVVLAKAPLYANSGRCLEEALAFRLPTTSKALSRDSGFTIYGTKRSDDHGDCRSHLKENAPALLAHALGSEAERAGRALNKAGSKGQFGRHHGGLRHKIAEGDGGYTASC